MVTLLLAKGAHINAQDKKEVKEGRMCVCASVCARDYDAYRLNRSSLPLPPPRI